MQVSSRLLLVWGIVNNFPFLAKSPAYSSMLVAWGVTEVIRYGFFVFTLSGYSPGIISWLRYNTFLILYPLGASSEAWLVYKAIEPAKKIRQEYAWVLQLILFIYIPGTRPSFESGNVANVRRFLYFIHSYAEATSENYERKASPESRAK
jgi:very-long-chain (3R)-3-hydroxyacyl-CoA dehydratase